MTYGEAIVRGKEKMQMKNGVFVRGDDANSRTLSRL